MKLPIFPAPCLAMLAGMALFTTASAVVTIDWALIGNAGNAADPATGSLYGAVSYEYKIARNETTIGQYAEFLNAVAATDTYGLWSTGMTASHVNGISQSGSPGSFTYSVAPGSGNKPITSVNWFDAARFANWLHNGQPTGLQTALTTEDGAYTLNGAVSGVGVSKNVGATVWIPSENEWYKAAYYDPTKNGGSGGYWRHANQSDSMTTNTVGAAGAANYDDGDYVGYPGMALTDVGIYGSNSDSFYGTNDQAGNVFEWNDSNVPGSGQVLVRGGGWGASDPNILSFDFRAISSPINESTDTGFRLATIPEPSTLVLTVLLSAGLASRRTR